MGMPIDRATSSMRLSYVTRKSRISPRACALAMWTAAFAGNDRCAVGVLDTLLCAGIDLPADISVIGYDDSRLARLTHNGLTTIAQDAEQTARLAVEAVIDILPPVQGDELPIASPANSRAERGRRRTSIRIYHDRAAIRRQPTRSLRDGLRTEAAG